MKAAEQGDVNAQWCLAVCYEKGNGVKKDLTNAIEWYTKAAEQGDKEAQDKLSLLQKNNE
jgi:TPR repeat protein